jgi:hypothetical protein
MFVCPGTLPDMETLATNAFIVVKPGNPALCGAVPQKPQYCYDTIKIWEWNYIYNETNFTYERKSKLLGCEPLGALPSCSAEAPQSAAGSPQGMAASNAPAGSYDSAGSSGATSVAGAVAGALGGTGTPISLSD